MALETILVTAAFIFAGTGTSMDPTFEEGHISYGCNPLDYGCQWQDLKEGDIIVFANEYSSVGKTIHRIVDLDYDNCGYLTDVTTKGDGNERIMHWEEDITEDRYVTKILIDKDPTEAEQEVLNYNIVQATQKAYERESLVL